MKLYRSLLDNPYSNKPDYLAVWVHLLLSANHKDTSFIFNNETQTVKAGQLITGRKVLSEKTGISESQIYKILNYFEKVGQIEQQKNNRFTLILILNWDKFQGNGTTKEQPSNSDVTTTRQPRNTYKNDKNVKNDNKKIYGEFVKLFSEEYEKLINQFGIAKTKDMIKRLNDYIGSKGDKYKSHYHTILVWENKNKDVKVKDNDYFRA